LNCSTAVRVVFSDSTSQRPRRCLPHFGLSGQLGNQLLLPLPGIRLD
jgi:hypothetical protein